MSSNKVIKVVIRQRSQAFADTCTRFSTFATAGSDSLSDGDDNETKRKERKKEKHFYCLYNENKLLESSIDKK